MPILINNSKELEVQIVNYYTYLNTFEDYENLAEYDFDEKNLYTDEFRNSHLKLNMLIKIFGRLENGETITVNVTNFTPYFHIKIPNDYTPKQCDALIKEIKSKVYYAYKPNDKSPIDNLIKSTIDLKKPFTEFTYTDTFKFLKLYFKNYETFKEYLKVIKRYKFFGQKFEIYEADMDPVNRLIHKQKLNASGIIKVSNYSIVSKTSMSVNTNYEIMVDHTNISKCDRTDRFPIKIISFDIEASSSHGDFPIATKKYQKLSQDLITLYNNHYYGNNPNTHILLKSELNNVIFSVIKRAFNIYYNNDGIRCYAYKILSTHQNLSTTCISTSTSTTCIPTSTHNLLSSTKELQKIYNTKDEIKLIVNNDIIKYINDNYKDIAVHIYNHLNDDITKIKEIHVIMPDNYISDIIRSCKSLDRRKITIWQKEPIKCIEQMLLMGIDIYNDGFDISKLYTKDNLVPKDDRINEICKSVIEILSYYSIFSRTKKHPTGLILPPNEKLDVKYFINSLNIIFDSSFPQLEGDNCIQIGSVFQRFNESEPYLKHIITLGKCEEITLEETIEDENGEIYLPTDELANVLVKLDIENALLNDKDNYIKPTNDQYKRLLADKKTYIGSLTEKERREISLKSMEYKKKEQMKCDKAEVIVQYCNTEEELLLAWRDLIISEDPDIIIGYNTFGFDYIFLFERAKELGCDEEFSKISRLKSYSCPLTKLELKSSALGENELFYLNIEGRINIDLFKVIQREQKLDAYGLNFVCNKFLYKEKVDLSPSELFILQRGTAEDRKTIARYCIIDCVLCLRLMSKFDILDNAMAMANVCLVPLYYIFLKGQGAKLSSLVTEYCNSKGFLMPKLENDESGMAYEGAIVLPPKTGIYFDPIVTLDFNSLYPSSIISENLSTDSFVQIGGKYDNLSDVQYNDIFYDDYKYETKKKKDGTLSTDGVKEKIKIGVKQCRYAMPSPYNNNEKALIPSVLEFLLKQRKDTRKRMKGITDQFKLKVLDGQQLAYKTCANSIYGQLGAPTGKFHKMEIAASTTAVGRKMIIFSKNYVEKTYINKTITLTVEETLDDDGKETPYANKKIYVKSSECVYGDTDSIFIKFELYYIEEDTKIGEKIKGHDAIYIAMALGKRVAKEISVQLKPPQNLDFEKCICPFILLRKKGYSGFYFTKMNNPYFYLNSMGIVLKRRDNAKIVKHVYGGALKLIMEQQDIEGAYKYVMDECKKVLLGEFPMSEFIISKTLKGFYKKPNQIAHNVLANRQARRDAGNKFASNDRVPYCYIKVNGMSREEKISLMTTVEKKYGVPLQGDYIETPQFINDNNLQIDYEFYITNQIKNPVCQIFHLVKGYENIEDEFAKLIKYIKNLKSGATHFKKINEPERIKFRKIKAVSLSLSKDIDKDKEICNKEEDEEDEDENKILEENDDNEEILFESVDQYGNNDSMADYSNFDIIGGF